MILTGLSMTAGIGQSVLGGISARAAADAQNKAARQSYKLQTTQANLDYALGNLAAETQHEWDKARVAQLRAIEAQNAVDQAKTGARIIAQAAEAYDINSAAMRDKFVEEERLRGTEASMNLAYDQAKLFDESNQTVQQYLAQQALKAQELTTVTTKQQADYAELAASLAYDEQKDHLQYQIEQIVAVADSAKMFSKAAQRQGGGNTAQRLKMDALKQLGMKWGQMDAKSNRIESKRALAASAMTDELAGLAAQTAIQSQDLASRVSYSRNRLGAEQGYRLAQFNELIIPSFDLAQRQYGRELQSLQMETRAQMDNAQQPYRQQQYMDPRAPIAGLGPVSLGPTKVQGPSWGSIAGQAVLGGVKGAMSGAYKKTDATGKVTGLGFL
jgi:hypothetical protein